MTNQTDHIITIAKAFKDVQKSLNTDDAILMAMISLGIIEENSKDAEYLSSVHSIIK